MIKRFHVLHVGHIELDNIGRNGNAADERRYSDDRLREAFFTARNVARLMDGLGFGSAEHQEMLIDGIKSIASKYPGLEDVNIH